MDKTLILELFVCVTGLLLHIAMKWAEQVNEARSSGLPLPGLFAYVKMVPAQTLISVLGTVAAFTVMKMLDWMNPGMAFACGYMGNSIAENLANRFSKVPS